MLSIAARSETHARYFSGHKWGREEDEEEKKCSKTEFLKHLRSRSRVEAVFGVLSDFSSNQPICIQDNARFKSPKICFKHIKLICLLLPIFANSFLFFIRFPLGVNSLSLLSLREQSRLRGFAAPRGSATLNEITCRSRETCGCAITD